MQQTVSVPGTLDGVGLDVEGGFAVILYNDDHNTVSWVVKVLMRVFGHPVSLAEKIMREAHERGRAIAEVEERALALLHKQQLTSFGLTAGVERVR